jgi:Ser/Thr protein kinase RdoA (MazF antagonist)
VLWHGDEGPSLSHVLVDEAVRTSVQQAHAGRAGAALRAVHDGTSTTRDGRQRSDPEAEAATTLRSLEHVAALAPGSAGALESLLSETVARLTELPDETGHLLHGDYKCDNLLVTDDRLVLLDFDRVTVGDPALDLGKLLADLRWWSGSGGRSPTALVDAFLYGYGPCPPTRMTRALLYDVLFQLRALGRRIPLHEPGWSAAVDERLAAAADSAPGCTGEATRQTRRVLGARAR